MTAKDCMLWVTLLCVGPWPSVAMAGILPVGDSSSIAIGHQIEFLEDPEGALLRTDILQGRIESVESQGATFRWQHAETEIPNFGYSTSVFWGRITLDFSTTAKGTRWLLENEWPHVDSLEVILTDMTGRELDRQHAGLGVPYSERRFSHRNLVFPLDVVAGQSVQLFIRIESGNALQFPLVLWERDVFLDNDHNEQFVFGMFYGILVVMLLYNLFIYVGVRERSYLDYVLFLVALTLVQLDVNKFSFEYLWPESPWWSMRSVPILVSLCLIVGVRFVLNFLDAQRLAPRLARTLMWLARLSIPGLFIPLAVPHKFAAVYCLGLAGLGCALCLITTAHVLMRGYAPARIFLLAWGTFLCGAVIIILRNFQVLPVLFITTYGFQIGIALGVLLLSFSLAARIRAMKEEKKRVQKEALRTQLEALRRAEESNRVKSEFLANISHELRTPLNALCNIPGALLADYSELALWNCADCGALYEGEQASSTQMTVSCPDCESGAMVFASQIVCNGQTHEHQHFLQHLEGQANQLLHLIDDVLCFSDAGSTDAELQCVTFKVGGLMTDILDNLNRRANEKNIAISFTEPPGENEITGDRQKLYQVLLNIIDNALKFTPEGGRIDVVWSQMQAAGATVIRCEVRDTGIGIEPTFHDTIFDSFTQVNSSHTRSFGGAGLGLAVTRELIRMHGGTIWVESELGKGARFIFTIPANLETGVQAVAASLPDDRSSL